MIESYADGVRLLVIPLFAAAAVSDWRTRRVPNKVWAAVLVLGLLALALDVPRALAGEFDAYRNLAIGVLTIVPAAYICWGRGMVGGADAKAAMALAIALPVAPVALSAPPVTGLFPLTVVTNALLLSMVVPIYAAVKWALGGRNLLAALEAVQVPFLVPVFAGLLVGVAYGDLLSALV